MSSIECDDDKLGGISVISDECTNIRRAEDAAYAVYFLGCAVMENDLWDSIQEASRAARCASLIDELVEQEKLFKEYVTTPQKKLLEPKRR